MHWAQKIGLENKVHQQAPLLSGGEMQTIAVARALISKPKMLFLDEPTAALDGLAKKTIEDILMSAATNGTKIVMSTHDLGQAKRLADEVLFLYRGRLLEEADAGQFFKKPKNDLAQSFMRGELLWWNRQELKPPEQYKERWQK